LINMVRKSYPSFMLAGANSISGKTGSGEATVLPAGGSAGALPIKETP